MPDPCLVEFSVFEQSGSGPNGVAKNGEEALALSPNVIGNLVSSKDHSAWIVRKKLLPTSKFPPR